MRQHLNTLFVTTQGAYVGRDGDALEVRVEREVRLRVPTINLGGLVCFGRVSASPAAMALCAESGIAVSFLTERGRFLARVTGFTPGNVLLRRQQYRSADDPDRSTAIARDIVAAKLANARTVLLRAIRDHPDTPGRPALETAAARLAGDAARVRGARSVDQARGIEGDGAATYFGAFDYLLTPPHDGFAFTTRSRRPPLDPINALLSFLYAMLGHDVRSACEASGLDAEVGFLHRDRPGRAGLGLDLMEELRPVIADRLAISLVNRRQVHADGFRASEAGGVEMDDTTRKAVLVAYQERKQETLTHPFLGEKTTLGLVAHIQARLMARHLRGDLDAYPPFIWR
jgi:CRISPR-associated protein Cas1